MNDVTRRIKMHPQIIHLLFVDTIRIAVINSGNALLFFKVLFFSTIQHKCFKNNINITNITVTQHSSDCFPRCQPHVLVHIISAVAISSCGADRGNQWGGGEMTQSSHNIDAFTQLNTLINLCN